MVFAGQSLGAAFAPPYYLRRIVRQVVDIGYFSLPVVGLTALFTGMVLALQSYTGFSRFNAESAVATVVVLSVTRELGPVIAGLMVAGRVGAAMAAEIGTMRVTEQIDALRTLATHPVDYLVVPRLAASMAALPLLMVEAIILGIGASYVVGIYVLQIDPVYSWYNMLHFTHEIDLVEGLVKAFIYGGIIALIGCYKGLTCGLGAEGVGKATTEAVVYSSITILIVNFFLTLTLGKILGLM